MVGRVQAISWLQPSVAAAGEARAGRGRACRECTHPHLPWLGAHADQVPGPQAPAARGPGGLRPRRPGACRGPRRAGEPAWSAEHAPRPAVQTWPSRRRGTHAAHLTVAPAAGHGPPGRRQARGGGCRGALAKPGHGQAAICGRHRLRRCAAGVGAGLCRRARPWTRRTWLNSRAALQGQHQALCTMGLARQSAAVRRAGCQLLTPQERCRTGASWSWRATWCSALSSPRPSCCAAAGSSCTWAPMHGRPARTFCPMQARPSLRTASGRRLDVVRACWVRARQPGVPAACQPAQAVAQHSSALPRLLQVQRCWSSTRQPPGWESHPANQLARWLARLPATWSSWPDLAQHTAALAGAGPGRLPCRLRLQPPGPACARSARSSRCTLQPLCGLQPICW